MAQDTREHCGNEFGKTQKRRLEKDHLLLIYRCLCHLLDENLHMPFWSTHLEHLLTGSLADKLAYAAPVLLH